MPTGLTAVISRTNSLELSVSITGNAASHTNADDISNLTFTFQNTAFSNNNAGDVTNSTKDDLSIDFFQNYYVAPSGGDFTSISAAVNAAEDRDIIMVASGTYTEQGITIDNSISILGSGANECIVQAHASPNTATDRVFYISANNVDVTIKNITIQNGYTAGLSGGALKTNYNVTLLLENVSFLNNSAKNGGALYLLNSNTTIINCTAAENNASGLGGFIYIFNGGSVNMSNSTITNNTAGDYTIYPSGTLTLTNCTITNNTNTNSSPALYVNHKDLTVENTIIAGNSPYDYGVDYGVTLTDNGNNIVEDQRIINGTPSNWWFNNSSDILYSHDYLGNEEGGLGWNRNDASISGSLNISTTLADNNTINSTQTLALESGSFAIDAGTGSDVDQRGHAVFNSISNVFINRATTYFIGFFGFLSSATISNITLAAINYTGDLAIGGLAGQDEGSTVINGCTINGSTTIYGETYVGGLIGLSNTSGTISDCHFSGNITADNENDNMGVGGFVGETQGSGTFSNCSATGGTVSGNGRNQGGFVGWHNNGNIEKCYSTMVITNTSATQGRIGGFAGAIVYSTTYGTINNCYATGSVTANSTTNTNSYGIGGFVGSYFAANNNKISNSYSTGAVSATNASSNVGGFSGEGYTNHGGAVNCFWDITASGQLSSAESGHGETGKTTAEMKQATIFLGGSWDFTLSSNKWAMNPDVNSGYPFLRMQGETPTQIWLAIAKSTDWNTAGNWSENSIPGSTNNIIIPDIATDPTISNDPSSPATCDKLSIEPDAVLTISAGKAMTIDGDLDNDGTFTINSSGSGTGSLIVSGTSTGNVIFKRYVDEATKDATWHYVSSPVAGQALDVAWMGAPNSIAQNSEQYMFYRFAEEINYWIYFGSTGNPEAFGDDYFVEARGYSATRTTAGELSFTGTMRTSDVTYAATYTADKGKGWNLVGNPFTSALAVTTDATATDKFLTNITNISLLDENYTALYIWDEGTEYGNDDYKIIGNPFLGSYDDIDQDYAQPGQAFMIKVSSAGNLQFTENMQAHASVNFYKEQKETWPSVELIVKNNELFNSTAIGFNDNMTLGLDLSYDVGKMKGNPNIALYTRLIEDNGIDFTIQALPFSGLEEFEVAVGIDILETEILEFSANQEKLDGYNIVLEDRQENTFTNLRWDTYFATISESGTGRFYLHFKNATDITEITPETKITLRSVNGKILINNPDLETGILSVINVAGQVLNRFVLDGNATQEVSLNQAAGIYIFSIQTQKAMVSKKVFVK